ncbi:MAG: hypothetical protein WC422_00580 [Candidatus Paceibacterota bacterium]|jgi:hypothetical protein
MFKKPVKKQENKGLSPEIIEENQNKIALYIKGEIDRAIVGNGHGNPLKISINKNGDGHSIFIQNPAEVNRPGFGIIYQIDVNLKNKGSELHYQDGAYGKDIYSPIEDAKNFAANIVEKVIKYPK